MPETRYIEHYDQQGKLIKKEPYTVTDEELALEQEARELEQLAATLDDSWTAAQTQAAVKKLIRRLASKGILP